MPTAGSPSRARASVRARARARARAWRARTRADAAVPASPGTPARYGREDVARAAVALADADGLDAVTFRAVAARLGTGVMSLYSYIPDKQTLVFDMSELVSAELELPAPTGDWRADMHAWRAGSAVWCTVTRGWSRRSPTCSRSARPRSTSSSSRSAPSSQPGCPSGTAWRRSPWSTGSC